ncbi:lamin-B1-like isoform X2 [Ptychodera flava]|uniref:lamin-B1-like isoform X2 n=1 Tax=Ptychodera flava TaxID=63121 RepID=UPI003969F201
MATQTRKQPSSASRTPASPLSPSRRSRIQEKNELQDLNDRLANYIDKVRQLEADNTRLQVQVTRVEETQTREVTNLKAAYESELSDTRRLLDSTSKEKARLQIEHDKWKNQAEDFGARLSKAERDLAQAEKKILALESTLSDKEAKLKTALNEKHHFEEEFNRLKRDYGNKEKQLDISKKQLEDETLLRVEVENRLQSLKEELAFKEELHKGEVLEMKRQKEVTITEVDNRAREEYESKMQEGLQELREQYEDQAQQLKDETEQLFHSKLTTMKIMAEKYSNDSAAAKDELRISRTKIDNLTSQVTSLKAQNDALLSRVSDLEKQLADEQEAAAIALKERDRDLEELRNSIAEQLKEYEELMGIKIALDMEIAAYRKLLEGEESRLNISPSPKSQKLIKGSKQQRSTPMRQVRGSKRRRIDESSLSASATASGAVHIIETDNEGLSIKLQNLSEKDQALGGWQLKRQVDDADEITYKFAARYVLKANATVTIWAQDAGKSHSPPTDLVWKVKSFGSGDASKTALVDNSGEVMATRTVTRQSSYDEEIFISGRLREGDPREKGDRCVVM